MRMNIWGGGGGGGTHQISGLKNQISDITPKKKINCQNITYTPKKSNIRYQGTPVPPPPHI